MFSCVLTSNPFSSFDQKLFNFFSPSSNCFVVEYFLINFSAGFLFRAEGVRQALYIIKSIFTDYNPWVLFDGSLYNCGLNQQNFCLMLLCIAVLLVYDIFEHRGISVREKIKSQDSWFQVLVIAASVLFVVLFGVWDDDNSALKFMQMGKIPLDDYHRCAINKMNELGVRCLDFRRKFWPMVDGPLPICNPPDDYDERVNAIRVYIENELHCGFARFRQYLQRAIGTDGDDMRMLFQLKERKFDRGSFDRAFAEAGDGDSLAAHYGYRIGVFCTNDRASHAGRGSVFSSCNRQKLKERFGVKIVSVGQLDQMLQGALPDRDGDFD